MKYTGPAFLMLIAAVAGSCSTSRKISALQSGVHTPSLSLSRGADPSEVKMETHHRDTLKVLDDDGREVLIMKAVRDEDGEMVATEQLSASFVTASFRNVAERHGKVDLRFMITIPPELVDGHWQLRLTPRLHMLGESCQLDSIMITGEQYRKAQLRGYQQYERFLNSISRDSLSFIRRRDLEVFLARNLPQVYRFRSDSSFVSDEEFASLFGVTEKEALDHYTNRLLVAWNRRKVRDAPRRFRQYVKVPIVNQGLRLDTVTKGDEGEISYEYVQTVNVRPALRKAQITLSGGVYEEDRRTWGIPGTDTLSFYISSLSTLVDGTERYLTRIVERRVDENSICWIEFRSASAEVDPALGNNAGEIGRIKDNVRQLMNDGRYVLDSVLVAASCSPEGSYASNTRLSRRRSESVCSYFRNFAASLRDSLRAEQGVLLALGDDDAAVREEARLDFIPRPEAENWSLMDYFVRQDSVLTAADKAAISEIMQIGDLDRREAMLSRKPFYRHLRESIYPHLRTVRFDFVMHLKGMVKDTLHTTEPDLEYMRGVQAIRDREYEKAISILRPYADYNTAIAYCSMDYNASALGILEGLPPSPRVNYMLALLNARKGDDQKALQCYLDACREDPSLVHRGNLDPEISELIHRYDLTTLNQN